MLVSFVVIYVYITTMITKLKELSFVNFLFRLYNLKLTCCYEYAFQSVVSQKNKDWRMK